MTNLKFAVRVPKTKMHYCAPLRKKSKKKRQKEAHEPELIFNYLELYKLQVMKLEAKYDWQEEVVDNG